MTKRSSRMDSLIKLALNEEQDAVKLFAQAQANLKQQSDYLNELVQYKSEYAESFNSKTNVRMDAVRLGQYRQFLDQIHRGIEHQKGVIEEAKNHVEEMREKWMEKYNRKRSLERAKEKFSQSEVMQETKLAQKVQDEHASRVKKKPWG